MHPKDIEGVQAAQASLRDPLLDTEAPPPSELEKEQLRQAKQYRRALRKLAHELCGNETWLTLAAEVLTAPAVEPGPIETRALDMTSEQHAFFRAGQQSVVAFIGRVARETEEPDHGDTGV